MEAYKEGLSFEFFFQVFSSDYLKILQVQEIALEFGTISRYNKVYENVYHFLEKERQWREIQF